MPILSFDLDLPSKSYGIGDGIEWDLGSFLSKDAFISVIYWNPMNDGSTF